MPDSAVDHILFPPISPNRSGMLAVDALHTLYWEEPDSNGSDAVSRGVGRLEAHYFLHGGFMAPGQLLRDVRRIAHLPATIIQGRYDVVCPPVSAYRLHQAWPEARLQMFDDAGHAAFEPGTARALVAATEQFLTTGQLK